MFEYSICNAFDDNIFMQQCVALEKTIKSLEKKELIEDVDGSKIQQYLYDSKKITVYNSYLENEVYVKSDIELESFFNN